MASDKKTQTDSAPKSEPAAKEKSTPDAASTKAAGSETPSGSAPANYSRGEGQKAVSQAYRDNWNAIFAKKKPKRANDNFRARAAAITPAAAASAPGRPDRWRA